MTRMVVGVMLRSEAISCMGRSPPAVSLIPWGVFKERCFTMGCCGWRASDRETPSTRVRPVPVGVLEHRRAEAESVLLAATAGDPLCRITEGGDPTEPKYAEGALAAVTELQRIIRATPDTGELAVARSLMATWEVEQDACAGRGVDWSAYRNGGVAELRSIVAELASGVDGADLDR